jgi:hypothetical protein
MIVMWQLRSIQVLLNHILENQKLFLTCKSLMRLLKLWKKGSNMMLRMKHWFSWWMKSKLKLKRRRSFLMITQSEKFFKNLSIGWFKLEQILINLKFVTIQKITEASMLSETSKKESKFSLCPTTTSYQLTKLLKKHQYQEN